MFKIIIISFFFLVAVNALGVEPAQDGRCVKSNKRIVFEHEDDCTRYYQCRGSLRYEVECPFIDEILGTKMHFNPEVNDCDFPYRTGCKKAKK